jgi:electron transport complex protein RnfB
VLIAVLAISALALLFGLLLGYSAIRFRVEGDPIVDKVNALLPQTQCGQCGYPGCRP